ncbi:hypothetical protein SUGI_0970570 [Cryptomeria japonica]|uniref:uncharacterized protein LOC131054866 n=1 Tax=Cryptomeria japonica TaxID=3369 RepID=UPI0024148D2F|nr:uncharacterized protein LOC131054866 [Cryptomeria japonica]GLJ46071.1 hypothetical protein SUGI_0970570 [Cryptomeria japonica]
METQMIEAIGMEIVVESASELKKAKIAPKTRAFALCFIHGAGKHGRRLLEHTTAVDRENGRNPSWNETISFALPESSIQQDRLLFTVQICNQSTWRPHVIGHVTVPLKELAKQPLENGESFQVLGPSGKPKGTLNLSVRLSKNRTRIHVHQFPHPRSHAVTAKGNDFCAQIASVAGISSNFF